MQTWNSLTNLLNKCHSLFLGHMSVHACEHVVRDVLKGYIKVFTYIMVVADDVKQLHGELVGISIVQTYPLYALYGSHIRDKVCDMTLAVEVYTIICQFLRDNLKLLHSLSHKATHLVKDFLLRTAYMLAGNQRNGTIGTTTVASLANLNVGIMRRCSNTRLNVLTRLCRTTEIVD